MDRGGLVTETAAAWFEWSGFAGGAGWLAGSGLVHCECAEGGFGAGVGSGTGTVAVSLFFSADSVRAVGDGVSIFSAAEDMAWR